jgi:hypothetical protein
MGFSRLLPASFCLVILSAGCGGSGSSVTDVTRTATIRGEVTAGPVTPTAQPGQTNDRALISAPIAIQNCTVWESGPIGRPDFCLQPGAVVAQTTSNTNGVYAVAVVPGRYIVVGQQIGTSAFPRPANSLTAVVAPANGSVTANVSYDTGIR